MKRRIFLICLGCLLIGGIGWWLWQQASLSQSRPTPSPQRLSSQPSLIVQSTLRKLSTNNAAVMDTSHLASGVVPPTNTWFSGFALQKKPQPGFAYPASYQPTTSGLEMGLPNVEATATAITGGHTPMATIRFLEANTYKITRYDELTVTLTYYRGTEALADITLAAGVPYASIRPRNDTMLQTSFLSQKEKQVGITGQTEHQPRNVALQRDKSVGLYVAPNKAAASTVRRYATNSVSGGHVHYRQQNSSFRTTLRYTTTNSQPTLIARLPHQRDGDSAAKLTYQSIFGDLPTVGATHMSYATPAVNIRAELALASISPNNKDRLRAQLEKDVAATKLDKPDTYFAGKQLQRAAQLLVLSHQLDDTASQQRLQRIMNDTFDAWLTVGKSSTRSFAYDERAHTITGNQASFGSDKEVNDHHFHYGYFVYAAATLGRYDDEFVRRHGAMINLLTADIVNYNQNEQLPQRRNFDPYVGHSWASGTAPFADGNNQESVSEAMNAWTGVALWGQVTNNQALRTQAAWLLSQETAAARTYYLQANPANSKYLQSYNAPLVSLNWGGKRVYDTFFSADPAAKLAIELLPLNPSMRQYATAVTSSQRAASRGELFRDYALLADPAATVKQVEALPADAIDDGTARSYLMAWTMSR